MQCPDDGTQLESHRYEGDVNVDRCSKCHGIWLDYGELQAIQDLREHDYKAELATLPNHFDDAYDMALAKAEGATTCPKCEREMEKREHGYCSQVIVDACPSCRGIWLHENELIELEIFFERCRIEANDARKGFFASLTSFFDRIVG